MDFEKVNALIQKIEIQLNVYGHVSLAVTKEALETLTELQKENIKLGGRLCVNCGRVFPASYDRTKEPEDCPSRPACTIDVTMEEAFEIWRKRAHEKSNIISEQAQKIKLLEDALEPFSIISGSYFSANYNDSDVILEPNLPYDGDVKPRLTFKDFSRARVAYNHSKNTENKED